jgi:glutamate dehydrogenase
VRWAVENLPAESGVGGALEMFKEPVAELFEILPSIVLGSQRAAFEEALEELKADGVPEDAASKIAALQFLGELMEVTRITRERGHSAADVGRVYFALTDEIDFALLFELLEMAAGEDVWEQRAVQGLIQDLGQARRNLTLAVLDSDKDVASVDDRLAVFRDLHSARLHAMRETLGEVMTSDNINVSALTVATREVVRQSRGILEKRS